MKRNLLVGVIAAAFGLLLMGLFTYLELRHTQNGAFWREAAANGGMPDPRFGDPFKFMEKWLRIHEFVMFPAASLLVGLLIGSFCRRSCWFALFIGVTPIIVINSPSDWLSVTSVFICFLTAWFGARSAQELMKHFAGPRQMVTAT